jgi:hypothetical protein
MLDNTGGGLRRGVEELAVHSEGVVICADYRVAHTHVASDVAST